MPDTSPEDVLEDAINLIDALLNHCTLPEKEYAILRQLTALELQAYAFSQLQITAETARLFTLILIRWQIAFTEDGGNMLHAGDQFEISAWSLAHAMGVSAEAVEGHLSLLANIGLITAATEDDGQMELSIEPALRSIVLQLVHVLYRDVIARHGDVLRSDAECHLRYLDGELDALDEMRPGDPRANILRADFEAVKKRTPIENDMTTWLNKPKAVYSWFDDLARIGERLAILGATTDTLVRMDHLSGHKIMVFSGILRP